MFTICDRIRVGLTNPPFNTGEPVQARVYFDGEVWPGLQSFTYNIGPDTDPNCYFCMRYDIEDEEVMLEMAYLLVDEGFNVELVERATSNIIELYRKDGELVIDHKYAMTKEGPSR